MSDVKCSVSECKYNKNVKCNAPSIQVNQSGSQKPSQSKETQCETFIPNL